MDQTHQDKALLITPDNDATSPILTPVMSMRSNLGSAHNPKPIIGLQDIAAKVKSNPNRYYKPKKLRKPPKKTWWKFIFRLLFSHVGLFLLVCGYAAFGAWLFIQIELPNEESEKAMKDNRALEVNDTINYLADVFWYWQDKNMTHSQWSANVREKLRGFEHYIIDSVNELNYDGYYDTWDWSWVFSKSLLFSVTTMSTIGYGNIAPKTELGMVVTILYALLGMPLLLLFLANIGDVMAKSLKYIYSRMCCRWCRSKRKVSEYNKGDDDVVCPRDYMRLADEMIGKEEYMPTTEVHVPIVLNLTIIALYIIFGSLLFSYWEGWSFIISTYFTFITLTTTGYGDYVPGRSFLTYNNSFGASLRMLFTCFYCAMGMALVSMAITLMQEQIRTKVTWVAVEVGLIKTEDEQTEQQKQQLLKNDSKSDKP